MKAPGKGSKRLAGDSYARGKYDAAMVRDVKLIQRIGALAREKEVSKIRIALAWLLSKVTAPIVGAAKRIHIEEAVKAVDIQLTAGGIDYLEELYMPHKLVGVMAENRRL